MRTRRTTGPHGTSVVAMVPARGGGAVAALLGTVGFVAVFLIEGWARPGYSPAAEYVSALALGPRGWVQVANFVMVGGCLLAFALWLRPAYPAGPGSRFGPPLLGVVGACLLLSGPFVMDPTGTPASEATPHGLAHGVLGAVVFVLMPVIPFVWLPRILRDAGLAWLTWPTLALGVWTAAADVAFTLASKVPAWAEATAPWAGALQRAVLIPFLAWVALFALGTGRAARRAEAS